METAEAKEKARLERYETEQSSYEAHLWCYETLLYESVLCTY